MALQIIQVVLKARRDFLGAYLLGQQGADDIDILGDERIDRDEKVAAGDTGILHDLDGRGQSLHGYDIGYGRQLGQALRVTVNDRDLVRLAAEHLGQVRSHLPSSFNDYSHNTIFDSI